MSCVSSAATANPCAVKGTAAPPCHRSATAATAAPAGMPPACAQLTLSGVAIASDAFFPFRDSIDVASRHGVQ